VDHLVRGGSNPLGRIEEPRICGAPLYAVRFQGRITRRKKLKPGRYTLVITATNSAGQRSLPRSLTFTIAKP
jgi:hypothetical protein